MKIFDFLENWLSPKNSKDIEVKNFSLEDFEITYKNLWQYRLALHTVAERIGAILSKCEIITYVKNEEIKSDTWYMFNVEPNPNQTSCEFFKQLVYQLVTSEKNEALIIFEKIDERTYMYVATKFTSDDKQLYAKRYYDVSINTGGKEYVLNKVYDKESSIHIKYTNDGLRSILNDMKSMYEEMVTNVIKAGEYSQKFTLTLDSSVEMTGDFEERLSDILNEDFQKFINGKNTILPLYAGMKLEKISNAQEVAQNSSISNDSVNKQTKEIFLNVGQPFNIPNSIILGTYEEDDLDDFLTFCIDPITDMLSEAINRNFYGKKDVLEGSYCVIDTKKIKHFDILTVANAINKLVSSGVYTINHLRRVLDEKPVDSKIGDVHWITRNYAVVGEYISDPTNYAGNEGKDSEETEKEKKKKGEKNGSKGRK